MVYHFAVHHDEDGLWAECRELPGCATQGDSIGELKRNAREVLDLYLDEPPESQVLPALPASDAREGELVVAPDAGLALALLLKHYRRERGLTQAESARRLGMRGLYSYQRLERGANPGLRTLGRLRSVFPELSIDRVLEE